MTIGIPEIGLVPVDKIVVDQRVQRSQFTQSILNKMIAGFDQAALGTIIVSKRNKNNSFVVLDGMHRVEVCRTVEGAPTELNALIYSGLTLEEEARLFRLYNQRSAVSKIDAFNASIHEGDEEALRLNNILDEFGMTVAMDSFAAIATALRIVRRPNGWELFYDALTIIDGAWTLGPDTCDGRMVAAIAEMLHHYEGLDQKGFITRLAACPAGEDGPVLELIKKAKAYHSSARPGRFVTSMLNGALLSVYNKGRRDSGRLPAYLGHSRIVKAQTEETEFDTDEIE